MRHVSCGWCVSFIAYLMPLESPRQLVNVCPVFFLLQQSFVLEAPLPLDLSPTHNTFPPHRERCTTNILESCDRRCVHWLSWNLSLGCSLRRAGSRTDWQPTGFRRESEWLREQNSASRGHLCHVNVCPCLIMSLTNLKTNIAEYPSSRTEYSGHERITQTEEHDAGSPNNGPRSPYTPHLLLCWFILYTKFLVCIDSVRESLPGK